MTRTDCPGRSRPTSISARRAVAADTGTTAAWAKDRVAGLGAISGLLGHGVLGEGAGGDAEDLVPDREPRDRGSRLDDDAGNVAAGNGVLRTGQAHGESHGVWLAGEQVLGAPVEPGGTHLHQHLMGTGPRAGRATDPEHLGGAVAVLEDRAHRVVRGGGHLGSPGSSVGSDGRQRVVLDLASDLSSARDAGQAGHEVEGHVDAGADAGAGDEVAVVDEA